MSGITGWMGRVRGWGLFNRAFRLTNQMASSASWALGLQPVCLWVQVIRVDYDCTTSLMLYVFDPERFILYEGFQHDDVYYMSGFKLMLLSQATETNCHMTMSFNSWITVIYLHCHLPAFYTGCQSAVRKRALKSLVASEYNVCVSR